MRRRAGDIAGNLVTWRPLRDQRYLHTDISGHKNHKPGFQACRSCDSIELVGIADWQLTFASEYPVLGPDRIQVTALVRGQDQSIGQSGFDLS